MEVSWETFSMNGMYEVCPLGGKTKQNKKENTTTNYNKNLPQKHCLQGQITPIYFQELVEILIRWYSVTLRMLILQLNSRASFLTD